MTIEPLVTVVVPTFDNRLLIELCLESMRRCTQKRFRVIVKDNGSSDGTADFVEASGLAELVIRSRDNDFDNVEYRTYDHVIRNFVRTPFFLVCHSDVFFLRPDWIDEILRHAHSDETVVMGGKILPAKRSGEWVTGAWLSPWYAWGRTELFKRLNLTWQRKSPEWCALHLPEVREYFGEQLLAGTPRARLFWEHGGYLLSLIDRSECTVVDHESSHVFHIGDMTGSAVKAVHFPDAPDVSMRVARANAIESVIRRTLAASYESDDAFLTACRRVATFARQNDLAALQAFRA
jgi:hypothetical protein